MAQRFQTSAPKQPWNPVLLPSVVHRLLPYPPTYFRVFGITKNSTGTALGNCVVHLFRTIDDVEVDQTTSDTNGFYEFRAASAAQNYYAVAYKAASGSAAFVQVIGSAAFGADSTTTVLTVSKTVTLGNRIIVGLRYEATSTGNTMTDNLGNVYTQDMTGVTGGSEAVMFSAPVTTAGSLTTITATHIIAHFRAINACEFSGVGTFSGTTPASPPTLGSGTTGTWLNSATIPANGLAVGMMFTTNIASAHSAGANSGSPSTAIIQDDWLSDPANYSPSFSHALPGASAVTGFVGTTTFASDSWKAVGGTYNPAAGSTDVAGTTVNTLVGV